MSGTIVKLVREGKYAAEVEVELVTDNSGWSPYLSIRDVKKLDAVRTALRRGDVRAAAAHGSVFELLPISTFPVESTTKRRVRNPQ